MLKNLFGKLKSEKSSKVKSQQPSLEIPSQISKKGSEPNQEDQFQLSQKLLSSSQDSSTIVKGEIKQVRYWTTEEIPEIFVKILSCPISHYNMLPHSQRKVKQIDLKKNQFPEYLKFMKPLLQKELPTFNHLLINHYPKGIGIMPHFDGPMYLDKVVVLSLGGPAVISFQENYKKESKSMQILLQDKSVHIFEQEAYQNFLHGIQNNKIDAVTFTIFLGKEGEQENNQNCVWLKDNEKTYKVGMASINNFRTVKSMHKVIQKNLSRLIFSKNLLEQQIDRYCFDFNQFQGHSKIKGSFIYIKSDEASETQKEHHRWKMEIQRQQRISITIREQFCQAQLEY